MNWLPLGISPGEVAPALPEVMIGGNIARVLRDVQTESAVCIDTGSLRLP